MQDLTALAWLLTIPSFPLLCTLIARHRLGQWSLVFAPMPALLASIFLPVNTTINLPWLLLGSKWGFDTTGQAFLFITALLWLSAALYNLYDPLIRAHLWRFRSFFLLTLTGNLLVVIAQDIGSFFLGFTLMGIAAYGLIAQQASVTTRRAGRIYLIWTILGEVLLFAGIAFTVTTVGSLYFSEFLGKDLPLIAGILLFLGFGIKIALPSLHAWLPIAHAAAPPAISALLSGVMVKTGILGLLRFLPAGTETTLFIADLLIGLGLIGAFYGVVFGLLQTAPKVILAYSTMSQLGVLSLTTGLVLQFPTNSALALALLIYIAHHAWVKGALFLGVGLFKQNLSVWILVGLLCLACILVGIPWSSGALAKGSLKLALPTQVAELAQWLLFSTLATTLLMGRFIWSLWQYRSQHLALHSPTIPTKTKPLLTQYFAWLSLLIWVIVWPFFYVFPAFKAIDLLPLLLGLAIIALLLFPRIPVGDLPILFAHSMQRLWYALVRFLKEKSMGYIFK